MGKLILIPQHQIEALKIVQDNPATILLPCHSININSFRYNRLRKYYLIDLLNENSFHQEFYC